MKCPNCTNGKLLPFLPGNKDPKGTICDICDGTGDKPNNLLYNPKLGEKFRNERLDKGKSLREWAKEKGISVIKLSRAERGYFEL